MHEAIGKSHSSIGHADISGKLTGEIGALRTQTAAASGHCRDIGTGGRAIDLKGSPAVGRDVDTVTDGRVIAAIDIRRAAAILSNSIGWSITVTARAIKFITTDGGSICAIGQPNGDMAIAKGISGKIGVERAVNDNQILPMTIITAEDVTHSREISAAALDINGNAIRADAVTD